MRRKRWLKEKRSKAIEIEEHKPIHVVKPASADKILSSLKAYESESEIERGIDWWNDFGSSLEETYEGEVDES